MSYFSGYGYGGGFAKRRRTDDPDYSSCEQCGEECHLDELLTCGACENMLCEDCLTMECDVCKDRERRTGEPNVVGTARVCERCVAYPGCDSCEDICICKQCIADHLATCTKKSRAQRDVSAANHEIAECEKSIHQLREEIESRQSKLRGLEADLAAAQERKSLAESELRRECGA